MTVLELDDYRSRVERSHLTPPAPDGGLPPARKASELPDPPPIAWLIDQVWPAGEFGLLVGDGGAFKSSVAIHMACAVAGGHRLFDTYQCLPRPALIISAEDHRDIVLMRAKAFCEGHGWGRQTLDNVYILAEAGPTLADRTWCEHIAAEVERIRPGLIVLDPWAELMGGDENSNTDARPAIKYLRHVAAKVGAAVVLVHHAGKMKEGGRALDRIRGASALPSAARVIWFFDFNEAGLTVENLKHSRAPRLAPFQLDRQIDSVAGNRGQWTSAHLTVREKEDPLVKKIFGHLMTAPNGERHFNDLYELVGGRKATLMATLDTLVRSGKLEVRDGPRKSRFYSRPARPSAPEPDRFPLGPTSSGTSGGPHAPAGEDLGPALPHPLKGVGAGTSPAAGAADSGTRTPTGSRVATSSGEREPVEDPEPLDPTDLLERLDERRGMAADE